MLFEEREPDLSRRYARAEAENLLDPWRLTESNFARASHGELIRERSDERLEADVNNPRFFDSGSAHWKQAAGLSGTSVAIEADPVSPSFWEHPIEAA